MCLYPRLIKNKKYEPNKKNGGVAPEAKDPRCKMVPIGCGYCMECMKKRKNEWKVRLHEDIKRHKNGIFVTLTFSNKSWKELKTDINKKSKVKGYALDNAIAKLATRRFLERWRKKHKQSVRHWLVTELGHQGTERVHLHGIIFTDHKEDIKNTWNYGYVWDGSWKCDKKINYVSEKTINYITKYITKTDLQHKYYKPIILCSPGIGKGYEQTFDAQQNKYKEGETKETYKNKTGHETALPIYYRNKIYNEEEREKLWIQKLDKEERWVGGIKVSTKENADNYYKLLYWYRTKNKRLGFGAPDNWQARKYEHERRKLKHEEIFSPKRRQPTRNCGLPSAQGSLATTCR